MGHLAGSRNDAAGTGTQLAVASEALSEETESNG